MTSPRGRGRPKKPQNERKTPFTLSADNEWLLSYSSYCTRNGLDRFTLIRELTMAHMQAHPDAAYLETMKKEAEAKAVQVKIAEETLTEQTKLIQDEAQKINTAIDRYVQLTAEKDVKDEVVLWDVDRTSKPRPNPETSYATDRWVDPVTYSNRAKRIALLVTRDLKEAGIESPKLNIEDIKNRFRVVVTRLEAEKEANRRYRYPKTYIIDEVRVHD